MRIKVLIGAVDSTCLSSLSVMAVLGESPATLTLIVSLRKMAVVKVERSEMVAANRAGAANPHWERNPPMAGPNIKPMPKAAPSSPIPPARVFLSVTSAI